MAGRLGIRLQVLDVGDEQNHFKQQIQILAGLGGNFDRDGVAAPVFSQQSLLGQFAFHAFDVHAGLVDLVDRDDKRNLRGPGVRDGFDRLRHDAVVCRDNEHHDIRDLGAASAHQRERFVARRIEERDLAVLHLHLIGADVLRDAAVFLFGHAALPDRIQQRGLSVIDVTHDRDDRRRAAAGFPAR